VGCGPIRQNSGPSRDDRHSQWPSRPSQLLSRVQTCVEAICNFPVDCTNCGFQREKQKESKNVSIINTSTQKPVTQPGLSRHSKDKIHLQIKHLLPAISRFPDHRIKFNHHTIYNVHRVDIGKFLSVHFYLLQWALCDGNHKKEKKHKSIKWPSTSNSTTQTSENEMSVPRTPIQFNRPLRSCQCICLIMRRSSELISSYLTASPRLFWIFRWARQVYLISWVDI